jgi:hypothetical protein
MRPTSATAPSLPRSLPTSEQHEDLGAADKVFEAATELQRQRIAGQRIAAADAAAVEMAQIFSNIDC